MRKPDYERDGVRLYLARWEDVLPSLDVGSVDAVISDPPYGIGTSVVSRPSKWQRRALRESEAWDDTTPDVSAVALISPRTVMWGGNYLSLPPSRGWLCWYKPDAPPSMASIELAWTSIAANARMFSHTISATNRERCGHPTQKPVALMRECIKYVDVPPAGVILDPFMGSGTTLRAAKDLGRKAIGIEIEERYCEIAVNRLRQEVLNL